MFKSQFYLYFSNSKRKRPENVHLYWLIYWEISANTLAHFTKQRKAEMWQLRFAVTNGFIYGRLIFSKDSFLFIAADEFCGYQIQEIESIYLHLINSTYNF